ncbi:permease [Streptomyces sp. NBC_01142]|uniref:permease n=1 Tax=Streptomyces sp. NBC_01142 TaxID=2975865 RepID=UPI00225A4C20|nr:permease [Streptomyces sp. NBC_01142]MCX4821482.1 permease [Streptomyces sp. NBC_01142]
MKERVRTAGKLFRIGLAAGRSTPGDRLRWWGLFGAAAAVAFVTLATVATVATYHGRETRADARGPVITFSKDAALLYREGIDSVGTRPVSVVFVHPLTPEAPLPAGVARWPDPGEVLLSPELVRTGRGEGILKRYGRFAGTITTDGLVTPSERIAYVRVEDTPPKDDSRWMEVSAFGSGGGATGEMADQPPVTSPVLALWALTGLPALALTVVAARVGSRTRDGRSSLLQALGGTWRHRMIVNVGEAAIPAVLGTLTAFVPYAVASVRDTRLVPTGYILDHRDVWAAWPTAMASAAVSLLVVLGIVVGTHRITRDGTSTRPASFTSRVPAWRLVVCGVGVALVLTSQYVPRKAQLVVFTCGTVVMWAFLSSVVALLTRHLGSWLADNGRRRGHAGRMIGGRWTHAHPGVIVRLALAMVIGIGIVAQMQVWTSRLGVHSHAAVATHQRIKDTVIEVTAGTMTASQTDRFRSSLPSGSILLSRTFHDPGGSRDPWVTIRGSCRDLRALHVTCGGDTGAAAGSSAQSAKVEEMRRWYGDLRFTQAPRLSVKPDGTQSLLVVTPAPGHLSAVKQAAYTLPNPSVQVEALGGNWLGSSRSRLPNWIQLFGVTGILFILMAGAVSAAAEFVRIRHALAPLSVLTGHRRVFRSVTAWHLTVPLLISTVVTGAVTAWHSVFFIALVQEGSVSWTVLGVGITACAAVSLTVGLLGARAAAREADQWRPTAD